MKTCKVIILLFLQIIVSIETQVMVDGPTINKFDYHEATPDEKLLRQETNHWFIVGNDYLEKILKYEAEPKKKVAKNIIIFLGDGMGISTVTAGRIYKGQRFFDKSGEEHNLIFDTFPNVALVKTYNVDMQIPDSAGTATALFTGVKTRFEAIGVDVKCNKTVFDKDVYEKSRLESIMSWAQKANKDTGIITTTRITHATPAATYAQVNYRDWECDSRVPPDARPHVKDIARQLVEDAPGNRFKVILGGGRQQMGYTFEGQKECVRSDGLNLTRTWLHSHINDSAIFATNNQQLSRVTNGTDYVLGLFDADHVPYNLLRDPGPNGTPSLSEMVAKGLQVLRKADHGFVLMVEGGRIDHGHHHNYARLAMDETSEFDKAIELALRQTSDTLILVTADHSHTLTINGYSRRGTDILGYGIETEYDKPSLTLSYANGPGFAYHYQPEQPSSVLGPWRDTREDGNRLTDPFYRHLATFEVADESHGGEDVGIWAIGPGSHLVRGVFEQNYVAHLISYVGCMGPRAGMNPECLNRNGAHAVSISMRVIYLLFLFYGCSFIVN